MTEVATTVLPTFGAPHWIAQTVIFVVALGFLPAVIISWAFEVTPDGIKLEKNVDRDQSITSGTGKKLDYITIAAVIVGIVYVAFAKTETAPPPIAEADVVAAVGTQSVAVLAFENMSPDPENAFFAEGISEEILNVLAGVNGLKVASRTSAFSFANTDTPIPEIASKLSVNHVLEGSVRKQGMRVRITAQLIDAGNDKHLWSDTYDRELTDIFVVQEEIAQAISAALLGVMGMSDISVDAPTKDFVAYELFLSGRKLFYLRGYDNLEASIRDLSAAVARDPAFAEAWSYLAAAQSTSIGYGIYTEEEIRARNDSASDSATKALELDPDQALAVAIQAKVLDYADGVEALKIMNRAADMAPNDAGILMWLADDYFRLAGNLSESLPLFERALALDPLSGINQGVTGIAYLMAGKREQGRELIVSASNSGWNSAMDMLLMDLLHTGEGDRALAMIKLRVDGVPDADFARAEKEKYLAIWRRIITGEITGQELEEIETTLKQQDPDFFFTTEFLAVGDLDRYFDRWFGNIDTISLQFYVQRLAFGPAGQPVVEHPRYMEVVRRLDLIPVWEELGYPFECELVNDDLGEHLSCANWPE